MQRIHDCVSPLDFRYYGDDAEVFERCQPYLSETAFIKYQARAEAALMLTFLDLEWCPRPLADEVLKACDTVTAEEVYQEEKSTGHVVRALVNCIARRVSSEAGGFVHLFATSADITDTANASRFQEFVRDVLLLNLFDLQEALIKLAREHAKTPQIGRTHGRHAEPITFGFAIALYVDRLGGRIQLLEQTRQSLPGQLSGAVGAYNALSLKLPRGAVMFEKLFLSRLGLQSAPGSISSQIVQPEYIADLGWAAHSCFSVLANLADDIRHLHRSEIGEVEEHYSAETVGSSTMPHKLNPKNFENVKGLWKAFAPRITTLLLDQISEHQRDLTNSSSQRFLPELFVALDYCTVRLARAMRALRVNKEAMQKNLDTSKEHIIAEPLYILLALQGYPKAYERVRGLARAARDGGKPIIDLAREDKEIGPYLKKLKAEHREILENPSKYTGQAYERAVAVCDLRQVELNELRESLENEKEVLSNIKPERFTAIKDQLLALEAGGAVPQGFCPAEDRKKFINAWIKEAKQMNQPKTTTLDMEKGVNS